MKRDGVQDSAPKRQHTYEIPLDQITAGPSQPRKVFSDNALKELSDSIREKGVLQPIVVRSLPDQKFEIICGERRYRAAVQAGITAIPVVIKELADNEALEVALIENIQREDLNPIEEAQAYQRLQDQHNYSHDQIAKKVGKDRATVSNSLRLLKLPIDILDLVVGRKLSGGHARALLSLSTEKEQRQVAQRVMRESLSVRQTEKLIQDQTYNKLKPKRVRQLDSEILHLENLIQQKLGTKVSIRVGKKNNGRLEIAYHSLEELDRILDLIGVYRA